MRHSIEHDPEKRCFFVTLEGETAAEGILAAVEDLVNHPRWRPGYHALFDNRKLCGAGVPNDGVEKISYRFISLKERLGNGRCALVMGTEIDFGLGRAWEMITEDEVDMSIQIFREIGNALAWIEAAP